MLAEDFLDLRRGALFIFNHDVNSFVYSNIEKGKSLYLAKDFILDNPHLFKSIDEDIVDYRMSYTNEDLKEPNTIPNPEVVKETEGAKEYIGKLASELTLEKLQPKQEKEMRNREEVLNRLEEVKAVITVLEAQLAEMEEDTTQYEAAQYVLDGFRQQYHTLNWVAKN